MRTEPQAVVRSTLPEASAAVAAPVPDASAPGSARGDAENERRIDLYLGALAYSRIQSHVIVVVCQRSGSAVTA